jgi:uncharacterized membrane protein YhhN
MFFYGAISFYLVQMKNKTIAYFFWLCCIMDILSNTFGLTLLHSIAKPLLMPGLMFLLVAETKPAKDKSILLIMAGLFFGWLGDVLLMFENIQPIFFILGLIGFLIGHLFYIFYFKRIAAVDETTKKGNLFFILPVAIYVMALLYLLFPSLGALKVPVIVYAIILSAMLCMAWWLYYKIDFNMASLFILGAACFVVSDSILAINKFYHSFAMAGFIIMSTYCTAQYLIVRGAIKVYQTKLVAKELVG